MTGSKTSQKALSQTSRKDLWRIKLEDRTLSLPDRCSIAIVSLPLSAP